jgi:endo-1,4-beta-xylanase
MRELADQRGIGIGAAVAVQPLRNVPLYGETLAREFNMLTPENVMKWMYVQPERGVFSFGDGDMLVEFAERHAMRVRGHTLVWHNQLPVWLRDGQFGRDELCEILCQHVTTTAAHYSGRIYAWDVVNEAINDQAGWRETLWYNALGESYLADAFRWAHEADPNALLFYNDYNSDGLGAKSDAIYAMVRDLLEQGVPIHGVGLQMHIGADNPPPAEDVAANIARLNALGLEVHITEMDVKIQNLEGDHESRFVRQAEVYKDIAKVCMEAQSCTAFVLWGFSDAHSWIPGFTGHDDDPLIFDREFQPKPAYHALMEALRDA